MILGLGKRYPSVEDEGIISNMIIKQIKQDICAGILMGFGKRNMGNEISKIIIIIEMKEFLFTFLVTELANETPYRFIMSKRGILPYNVQQNPRN